MDSFISGSDEDYGIRSINSEDWDPEDRANSIISLSSAASSISSQQSFLPTSHNSTVTPTSQAMHDATSSIEPFIEHPADYEAPPAEHHEVTVETETKSDEEAKGAAPSALSLDCRLADISPPGSPGSFVSTSGPHSSGEASPRLGSAAGWGRSEGGTSVVSDGEGELSELVMPSMRFAPPSSSSERSSKATPSSSNSRPLKLLIYGKTEVERRRLGRLLGDRRLNMHDTDTDLSCSFLSNRMSDRSRNSSAGHFTTDHHGEEYNSSDFDDLIELPDRTLSVIFVHPSDDLPTQELVDQLLAPLARLDSLLNPSYPSTQRLAGFIAKGSEGLGAIEGCLMLFSSP